MLSTVEDILLIIPVALQALVTSVALIMLWKRGRRQLFLACEGWMSILLSLLDLLSQVYAAERSNLHAFRVVDTLIGATSFLPILFYALFLCSLTVIDFIIILPPYLRSASRLFFILFVPVLVALQEVASFIGIAHRLSPTSMIVFQSNHAKDVWSFFDSTTLALFTAFQATVWCFATIRIVQILLEQRQPRFQISGNPTKLRGIGWINMGIMLGATETIIGFAATGCFPVIFVRRIVRAASRVLFCIGLMIGLDDPSRSSFAEVASTFSAEKVAGMPYGTSGLKPFISNPRTSTFQQLSPTATTFHQKPKAPSKRVVAPRGPRAPAGLPGMNQFSSLKDGSISPLSAQRVTILFDQGMPKLDVRLSLLELPTPPPIPVIDSASERRYSPFLDAYPKPFVPPFAEGVRDSTGSSLDDAKIISVPRTLYLAEMTKATVIRTPSGRVVNRPVSQLSSLSLSVDSVKTRESKGKRVMPGEKNHEFFRTLMMTALRSPNGIQAEQVEGAAGTRSSLIVSSYGPNISHENEAQYASRPLSSYSLASNQRSSPTFSPGATELSSPDWLSMGSTPGTRSRYTSVSFSASEHMQSQDNQASPIHARATEIMSPQSFLQFDSSRPSTEEYYGKLFRPSPEVLSRNTSYESRLSASYTRPKRSSTRSFRGKGSLTAHSSLRLLRAGSTSKGTLSPTSPQPRRNPSRRLTQFLLPPSQVQVPPNATLEEFSQPQSREPKAEGEAAKGMKPRVLRDEPSSKGEGEQREIDQIKAVGIAPQRTTSIPTPARFKRNPSFTTELLFAGTEEAQQQHEESTVASPAGADSISVYSRESTWSTDQRSWSTIGAGSNEVAMAM